MLPKFLLRTTLPRYSQSSLFQPNRFSFSYRSFCAINELENMRFYQNFKNNTNLINVQKECLLEFAINPSETLLRAYVDILADLRYFDTKSEKTALQLDDAYFKDKAQSKNLSLETLINKVQEVEFYPRTVTRSLIRLYDQLKDITLSHPTYNQNEKTESLKLILTNKNALLFEEYKNQENPKDKEKVFKEIKDIIQERLKQESKPYPILLNTAFFNLEHFSFTQNENLLEESETIFNQILQNSEEDIEALYGRGKIEAIRGEIKNAIATYTECLNLSEDYAPAWLARGECYCLQQQYALAINDISKFIDIHHKYYEVETTYTISKQISSDAILSIALWKRGYSYYMLEDFDVAETDLKACIELEQADYSIACHYYAKCLMKKGKIDLSIDYNTKALNRRKNLIGAYRDRAQAYEMVGNDAEAEKNRRMFAHFMSELALNNKLPPKR